MHPEIEKFWNNAGYRIGIYSSSKSFNNSSMWRYYYQLENKNGCMIEAGASDPCDYYENKDASCKIYYLNNSEYCEEDMLRLIRLKAFL